MRYWKILVAILVSTVLFSSLSSAQLGPSFDCKTDRGKAEQAICGNDELRQMDLAMANLYFTIQADNTRRKYRKLKKDQVEWLKERNDCGANVRCLRRAYRERIGELTEALDTD
jgi:uncharacterized protein